jgi:hypothetical protein
LRTSAAGLWRPRWTLPNRIPPHILDRQCAQRSRSDVCDGPRRG